MARLGGEVNLNELLKSYGVSRNVAANKFFKGQAKITDVL